MNQFRLIFLTVLMLGCIDSIENLKAKLFQLSRSSIDGLWSEFKSKYGKGFSARTVELKKRVNFEKNLEIINRNNEKFNRGEVGHQYGINKFSDFSQDEFRSTFLNLELPTSQPVIKQEQIQPLLRASIVPDSIDWRNVSGYVQPIRDQGACGSCWAFSAISSLEGQHKRYTGASVQLSEQNLVDCVYTRSGCNGGWMATAWDYIRRRRGVNTRSSYPYTGRYGTCRFSPSNVGSKDNGTIYITNGSPDESKLVSAIATVGPISIALDATYFQYYVSGVYNDTRCSASNVNHAVNAVGYTPDHFIVRNSWGTNWGESGYIRIKRGSNLCGISTWASYPIWIR